MKKQRLYQILSLNVFVIFFLNLSAIPSFSSPSQTQKLNSSQLSSIQNVNSSQTNIIKANEAINQQSSLYVFSNMGSDFQVKYSAFKNGVETATTFFSHKLCEDIRRDTEFNNLLNSDSLLLTFPPSYLQQNAIHFLANNVSKELNIPRVEFIKNKSIPFYAHISEPEERRKAVYSGLRTHDFVSEKERLKVKGRTVLLIDDTISSGATLEYIAFRLYEAGAKKVIVRTLLHLDSSDLSQEAKLNYYLYENNITLLTDQINAGKPFTTAIIKSFTRLSKEIQMNFLSSLNDKGEKAVRDKVYQYFNLSESPLEIHHHLPLEDLFYIASKDLTVRKITNKAKSSPELSYPTKENLDKMVSAGEDLRKYFEEQLQKEKGRILANGESFYFHALTYLWHKKLELSELFWKQTNEFPYPSGFNIPHIMAYNPSHLQTSTFDGFPVIHVPPLKISDARSVDRDEINKKESFTLSDEIDLGNFLLDDPSSSDFALLANRFSKIPNDIVLVTKKAMSQRLNPKVIKLLIDWSDRGFTIQFNKAHTFVNHLHVHLYPATATPITNRLTNYIELKSIGHLSVGHFSSYDPNHIALVSDHPDELQRSGTLLSHFFDKNKHYYNVNMVKLPDQNKYAMLFFVRKKDKNPITFNTIGFIKLNNGDSLKGSIKDPLKEMFYSNYSPEIEEGLSFLNNSLNYQLKSKDKKTDSTNLFLEPPELINTLYQIDLESEEYPLIIDQLTEYYFRDNLNLSTKRSLYSFDYVFSLRDRISNEKRPYFIFYNNVSQTRYAVRVVKKHELLALNNEIEGLEILNQMDISGTDKVLQIISFDSFKSIWAKKKGRKPEEYLNNYTEIPFYQALATGSTMNLHNRKLKIVDVIGVGNEAKTYKVLDLVSKETLALKVGRVEHQLEGNYKIWKQLYDTLPTNLKSFFLKYYSFDETTNSVLMEYYPNSQSYTEKYKSKNPLSISHLEEAIFSLQKATEALGTLYKLTGQGWGDFAGGNLLISDNLKIKIIDGSYLYPKTPQERLKKDFDRLKGLISNLTYILRYYSSPVKSQNYFSIEFKLSERGYNLWEIAPDIYEKLGLILSKLQNNEYSNLSEVSIDLKNILSKNDPVTQETLYYSAA